MDGDELSGLRRKRQNEKVRSAAVDRLTEFTNTINDQSEASKAPAADIHGSSHPSDVHIRLPSSHADLQEHMIEDHGYDEESAETWTHSALIGQHNEAHVDPDAPKFAREYDHGWHFHARPMRGV